MDHVIDGSSDGIAAPQIPVHDNAPSAILPNTTSIPAMS